MDKKLLIEFRTRFLQALQGFEIFKPDIEQVGHGFSFFILPHNLPADGLFFN